MRQNILFLSCLLACIVILTSPLSAAKSEQELLYEAIVSGELSKVKAVVATSKKIDLARDASNQYTHYSVVLACQWGFFEIAGYLTDKGADLYGANPFSGNGIMTALDFYTQKVKDGYSAEKLLILENELLTLMEKMLKKGLLLSYDSEKTPYYKERGTPLMFAVQTKSMKIVQLLLKHNANPLEEESFRKTAITAALASDSIEIADFLINQTDPSYLNSEEYNQILYGNRAFRAIQNGEFDIVKALVESGKVNIDKMYIDGYKHDIFMHAMPVACDFTFTASYEAKFPIAYYLIEKGADVNGMYRYGGTCLNNIMFWKRQNTDNDKYNEEVLKLAKLLIKKGANVNLMSENKYLGVPLMHAAYYGIMPWVKLLKESGADPYLKDNENQTAIDHAKNSGFTDVANYLSGKSNDDYEKTLFYLVKNNKLDEIKNRLETISSAGERKKLINEREEVTEMTLLHYAGKLGYYELASYLISNGADVNLKAQADFSALHYATAYSQEKVALLLLENGANPNIVQSEGCATGYTALHWATQNALTDVIRFILKKGYKAKDARNPLWAAITRPEIFRILVNEGNIKIDPDLYSYIKTKSSETSDEYYKKNYQEILDIMDSKINKNEPSFRFIKKGIIVHPFINNKKKVDAEPYDIKDSGKMIKTKSIKNLIKQK